MAVSSRSVGGWTLAVLLGLLFMLTGLTKVADSGMWEEKFLAWGLPGWFVLPIGLVELAGV